MKATVISIPPCSPEGVRGISGAVIVQNINPSLWSIALKGCSRGGHMAAQAQIIVVKTPHTKVRFGPPTQFRGTPSSWGSVLGTSTATCATSWWVKRSSEAKHIGVLDRVLPPNNVSLSRLSPASLLVDSMANDSSASFKTSKLVGCDLLEL